MGKKSEQLNSKTPKWFQDWHSAHFMPVRGATRRNERWIYVIIAAIIGSGLAANGNGGQIVSLIRGFFGG